MDSKGRIAIPARFRDQISADEASELRLAQSHSDPEHLKLFPKTAWNQLIASVEAKSNAAQKQAFRRLVVGGAHLVSFDVQGRILVPQLLREAAELKSDVVIVGEVDQIQIWSPTLRQKAIDNSRAILRESSALLADVGW